MSRNGELSLFILAMIIVVSFVLTGGLPTLKDFTTTQNTTNQTYILAPDNPQPAHQTLQLQTLTFTTSAPTTVPAAIPAPGTAPIAIPAPRTATPAKLACNADTGLPMADANCACPADYLLTCLAKQCTSLTVSPYSGRTPPVLDCTSAEAQWCGSTYLTGDGIFCLGKPVIYLYPLKDTTVNVTLNIPGSIVESIPAYVNGGWEVLAHPNGSLEYLGKTYNELYYESSVNKVNPPKQGFLVAKSQAEAELTEITTKLGLIKPEQDEFLSYWLPRIDKLSAPYLFISVIDQ